jgi:uncharacterized membrane protein YesL
MDENMKKIGFLLISLLGYVIFGFEAATIALLCLILLKK